MPLYTKQSLDFLRQRIDLSDILSIYLDLKRVGSSYQALCPFHEEKTPSFKVQRGEHHFHCYGCGAHGDAIQFLMESVHMGFTEAVEFLAERYHVVLEKETGTKENKGPSKTALKEVLHFAKLLYHTYLLYSKEGHEALQYLYQRGLDLDFVLHFQIGYAPKSIEYTLKPLLAKGVKKRLIEEVGLLNKSGNRPFFADRILFPILDHLGSPIAFSARKFKEETFGGKYINSPETILFKKSNHFFGISYSRRRIAKEKKVLLVEGQIDALRLIQAGLDYTLAPLGTAFGQTHVKQLQDLGVQTVYLALDGDVAGREAGVKIGDLLQSQGVEVFVLPIPQDLDPDTFIRQEGVEKFEQLFDEKLEYLPFMIHVLSEGKDVTTPAGKNLLITQVRERLQSWENPIMVHESVKRLAFLLQVPQEILGIGMVRQNYEKQAVEPIKVIDVNYDRILEGDLLRWLILFNNEANAEIGLLFKVIYSEDFILPEAKQLFLQLKEAHGKNQKIDLLSLASYLEEDTRVFVDEIFQRKIAKERGDTLWKEALQKLLDRNWMGKREEVRSKIQSGQYSDDPSTGSC